MAAEAGAIPERVAWVDYAKGISIILVVMMHSTLGVEGAAGGAGFMQAAVAFAAPFRIAAFFLIAGLFLARSIDSGWTDYLDRTVLHFVYFYALWATIQSAIEAPALLAAEGPAALAGLYLRSFVEPSGTLWFIYLLPLFFVAARLLRRLPPAAVLAAGAALAMAEVSTGATVIDEFAGRFVYFYAGHALAPKIFALAALAQRRPALAGNALLAWGFLNHVAVAQGLAGEPVPALALGFAGAGAVVAAAALLATGDWVAALRFVGRHWLVVYLAFFLPMATSRIALLQSGYVADPGTVSLLVTVEAVVGALVIYWMATRLKAGFLFERPERLRLEHRSEKWMPVFGINDAHRRQ